MKLILPKLKKQPWKVYPSCLAENHIVQALQAWLALNGIYLGDPQHRGEKTVRYNYVHYFYSWTLYFWTEEREAAIKKIPRFLKSQGYKVEIRDTWHWQTDPNGDREKIEGIDLWFYPPSDEDLYKLIDVLCNRIDSLAQEAKELKSKLKQGECDEEREAQVSTL